MLDARGTVIESEGLEAVCAADGHEAVEKFHQQPINMVLLDLNKPVKGGWDGSRPPILPFSVFSGKPIQLPFLWSQALGCSPFCVK